MLPHSWHYCKLAASWFDTGLTSTLGTSLWIGLNSLDFESGWQWSNGNPYRYLNWGPGLWRHAIIYCHAMMTASFLNIYLNIIMLQLSRNLFYFVFIFKSHVYIKINNNKKKTVACWRTWSFGFHRSPILRAWSYLCNLKHWKSRKMGEQLLLQKTWLYLSTRKRYQSSPSAM